MYIKRVTLQFKIQIYSCFRASDPFGLTAASFSISFLFILLNMHAHAS